MMEINILFAFESSANKNTTFGWFKGIHDGKISIVCVLDCGLWKINREKKWEIYKTVTEDFKSELLAAFVGIVSNTSFSQHLAAQGRERLSSLEGGIGQYFKKWESL